MAARVIDLEMPESPPSAVTDAWAPPGALRDLAWSGRELLDLGREPARFVVDGVLEVGDLAILTGREKLGLKTWLALDLAIAVIAGGKWLGRDVAKQPGIVVVVSTETSARHVARRLESLCGARLADVDEVARRMLVVTSPISMISRDERDRVSDRTEVRTLLAAERANDPTTRARLARAAGTAADAESRSLGSHLDALDALESAPRGEISLVVLDTLRQTLVGDENSSADAARWTRAARELARDTGAIVLATHHTNKTGDGADARSARGSTEITASADVLVTIDTSGEWPTAHYTLRNHESPDPVGYRLADVGIGIAIEVLAPSAKKGMGVTDDEVLAVLRAHAPDALTVTRVRSLVAIARGGAAGAKASPAAVTAALQRLTDAGAAAACTIRGRGGDFVGYRAGADSSPAAPSYAMAGDSWSDGVATPAKNRRAKGKAR